MAGNNRLWPDTSWSPGRWTEFFRHGLTMWNGVLYGCDAGIHPGWPNNWSKTTGQIFRIDLI